MAIHYPSYGHFKVSEHDLMKMGGVCGDDQRGDSSVKFLSLLTIGGDAKTAVSPEK